MNNEPLAMSKMKLLSLFPRFSLAKETESGYTVYKKEEGSKL